MATYGSKWNGQAATHEGMRRVTDLISGARAQVRVEMAAEQATISREYFFSASGHRAYGVQLGDTFLGLVWRERRRGQRTGDWTYERDGGPTSYEWVMTRGEAVKALLVAVQKAVSQ